MEDIDPAIARSQKITACEVAYAALECSDEPPLRWFTTSILRLPATWTHIVGISLWKTQANGGLGWRDADNPFGYLRVVARRTALRWQPELVFGNNADRVLRPRERAISTLKLKLPEDGGGEGADAALGLFGTVNLSPIKRNGVRVAVWEPIYDPLDDLDYYILPELCFNPPREGLWYDWDTIGCRAGFDADEIAMLKARFKGFTRTRVGRFLSWDEHRVQSVWRRVNRRLDDHRVLLRLEKVLTGDVLEPPQKILAA